ncbi:MAG: PEGA domain-containing protein [Deltaproteobacteria bacterium]|nr:PEGA domain-containing protein [Deltaproteobacteria bacterium]
MRRVLVLGVVLLTSVPAQAKVGVLGFESSTGGRNVARWTTEALRHWVVARGMSLGSHKTLTEMKLLFGCDSEQASCMAQVAKSMGVRRLIFGKVRRRGSRYVVTVRILDMRRSGNIDTVSHRLPVSGVNQAMVRRAALKWLSELISGATSGKLVLEGSPVGATVTVDGKVAGPLPESGQLSLDLMPGRHVVSLSKDGYVSRTIRIVIRLGGTKSIHVELDRTAGVATVVTPRATKPKSSLVETQPKKKSSNPRLGWQIGFYTSAGLGVALLVTGIVYGMKVKQKEDDTNAHQQAYVDKDNWVTKPCDGSVDPNMSGWCKDGKKMANISTAMFVTGGLLAAAAGVFSYFAFIKHYPKEEQTGEALSAPSLPRFTIAPAFGRREAGLNMRLDF